LGGRHRQGRYQRPCVPFSRDREDFAAGPSLPKQTIAALEASQLLIVICSPNSAKSKYVNEEIRRFKALGRGQCIFPVIVDGEPHDPERECFPPALAFRIGPDGTLTDEREEPIAADARPNHDGKDVAKLKVVAGLLGLGLDEIVRRAERARRKRLGIGFAVLSLVLAIVAGFAVWAEFNRSKARQNLSSALTGLALTEVDQRPLDAAKYALAAWPRPGAMDLPKRDVTLNAVSRSLAGLHERMRIATGAPITSVAFSPDGARVLAGSWDNTARLWDAATGKEIRSFKGHEGHVNAVAFSPDGARVLTRSWDKTARLWDAATGKEIRAFKAHERVVSSVAFSPDGARVLTESADNITSSCACQTRISIRPAHSLLPGLPYDSIARLLHARLSNAGPIIDPSYTQALVRGRPVGEDEADLPLLIPARASLNREIKQWRK
jgi:hypothetical protein